mgnify:CR=1 FL=1
MTANESRLLSVPLEEWAASMAIAVDEIDLAGQEALARHCHGRNAPEAG